MGFRKGILPWFRRIVKWGLIFVVCYWLVDYYLIWSETREYRESYRKKYIACEKKLSDSDYLPIHGGGLLDTSRVRGFHWYLNARNDECVGDNLKGLFIWTGKEIRNAFDRDMNIEPLPDWHFFSIEAGLYMRSESSAPSKIGFQSVDWPEELTVKLKNYPGLELWLTSHPPSVDNKSDVQNFVIPDWRRSDGVPQIINCSGLDSSWKTAFKRGLSAEHLLGFDKVQLENIEFGDLNVPCNMRMKNFFSGGGAWVGFGIKSLRVAPQAIQSIGDYLSRSVITGSER